MPRKFVGFTIRPDVIKALDLQRGDVSRSRTVERLLCERLNLPLTLEESGEVAI